MFIHTINFDVEIDSEVVPIKSAVLDLSEGMLQLHFANCDVAPKNIRVKTSANLIPTSSAQSIRGAYEFSRTSNEVTFSIANESPKNNVN